MTNDLNTTTTRCTARNAGRAVTVLAGAAGALLLWAVTALLAGLAAWGLLALLERSTRHAARTYRIIASVVLLISLAGPLGSGIGAGATLALLGMHTTVGAALIIGLPGVRNCR